MENGVAQGIALALLIGLGSVLYSAISSKIAITWGKISLGYIGGFAVIMIGINLESIFLIWVGVIPIAIFGFLAYGKMFSK